MKYLLTAFCALLLFSCSKDDDKPITPPLASRTVIIYISGENSLSSFAPDDLEEMIEPSKLIDSKNQHCALVHHASKRENQDIAEQKNGEGVKDTGGQYRAKEKEKETEKMSENNT